MMAFLTNHDGISLDEKCHQCTDSHRGIEDFTARPEKKASAQESHSNPVTRVCGTKLAIGTSKEEYKNKC